VRVQDALILVFPFDITFFLGRFRKHDSDIHLKLLRVIWKQAYQIVLRRAFLCPPSLRPPSFLPFIGTRA